MTIPDSSVNFAQSARADNNDFPSYMGPMPMAQPVVASACPEAKVAPLSQELTIIQNPSTFGNTTTVTYPLPNSTPPGPTVTTTTTTYTTLNNDALVTKKRRRRRRQTRATVAGVSGAFVGLVVLGPLGAVVGGFSGALIARGACKAGERRKDRRLAKQNAAQQLNSHMPVDTGVVA